MSNPPEVSSLYSFGDFRLETDERRLSRGDAPVALTPKTFDLLLFLVQNQGRLLRKEDLLASVWPDAAVEENNLTVGISALRKVLGESRDSRFIETVPKIGYRFVAPVTKLAPANGLASRLPEPVLVPDALESLPASLQPESIPPALPIGKKKIRYRWSLIALGLTALVLISGFLIGNRLRLRNASPPPRRLAILPFRNLRGNAEDQFLALSLADAVITRLGSIRELTVRPSYDIQKYVTGVVDLGRLAADLEVDAVLTATYIHEEDKLRVAGQLIDVKTHGNLWNGTFDLKYSKLLTVQEKVAAQIVEGLRLTISPAEAASMKTVEAIDPLAYEYYLRGIDLYAKNEFQLASRVLEKSVELAPGHAPSWANLGRAYTACASFQFGGDELYRKAEAAFRRAVALEPNAIDARVYMANMFTDTGRVEQAVPLLRQAVQTNSSHAESHWELGYAYRFAGMLEASAAEGERARQLDPAVKLNSSALNSYLYLGQYDRFLDSLSKSDDVSLIVFYRGLGEYYQNHVQQAIANFDRAFELDRTIPQSRVGKALSFAIQRQNKDARLMLRALEARIASRGAYDPEAVYKLAQGYAVAGDKPSALRTLKRSVENGFFPYPYLLNDPLLDTLRSEAQFAEILAVVRRRHDAFRKTFF